METRKLFFPASERNGGPIRQVLEKYLKNSCAECLEIASGTGQHVTYFAKYFPQITFQPSDCSSEYTNSIRAYVSESGLKNIRDPLLINITDPVSSWNLPMCEWDVMLNINMVHISPWECSLALFRSAGMLLKNAGYLFTYGPYAFGGKISPESNVLFDQSLKSQNSQWGLRDVEDLKNIAASNHLYLECIENMPSNNHILVWRKLVA